MAEQDNQLLEKYVKYIEKLAQEKSSDIFTNGGIDYASQMMAVLLKNTERDARFFCNGFKPELITTEPYWSALKDYLKDNNKTMHVLVECPDYKDEEPLILLRKTKEERGNESIQIKVIKPEIRDIIFKGLDGKRCNFSVFDENKFRFEYDPDNYKAFGSFNHSENAKALIKVFDAAFASASELN